MWVDIFETLDNLGEVSQKEFGYVTCPAGQNDWITARRLASAGRLRIWGGNREISIGGSSVPFKKTVKRPIE